MWLSLHAMSLLLQSDGLRQVSPLSFAMQIT
jgi:hypothetical protein